MVDKPTMGGVSYLELRVAIPKFIAPALLGLDTLFTRYFLARARDILGNAHPVVVVRDRTCAAAPAYGAGRRGGRVVAACTPVGEAVASGAEVGGSGTAASAGVGVINAFASGCVRARDGWGKRVVERRRGGRGAY